MFNIYQVIVMLGAGQGLILFTHLINQKPHNKLQTHRLFIALYVLIFALAGIKVPLQELAPEFYQNLYVPLLYRFALGPLLYFYVISRIDSGFKWQRRNWLHFVPCLLFDVFLFLFDQLFLTPDDPTREYLIFSGDILGLFSIVLYIGWSVYHLLAFRRNLDHQYANICASTLRWLYTVIALSTFVAIAYLSYLGLTIHFMAFDIGGVKTYYPPYIAAAVSVFLMGYLELRTIEIPEVTASEEPADENKKSEFKKQALSGVNEHETLNQEKPKPEGSLHNAQNENVESEYINQIAEDVKTQLTTQELYLNENLTLKALAQSLKMPINDVSKAINSVHGMTFSDFINRHRVEYSTTLLENGTLNSMDVNMLEVAMSSGFNSKASFYRHFKRVTGVSPGAYMNKN